MRHTYRCERAPFKNCGKNIVTTKCKVNATVTCVCAFVLKCVCEISYTLLKKTQKINNKKLIIRLRTD